MAYTDIDICNFALGRCGIDATIAAFTELSKEARNCARFYPLARDIVLEKVPWPFAVKTAALAQLPASTLLSGFTYGYAIPADAATFLEVISAGDIGSSTSYYAGCACDAPWMPCRDSRYPYRRALGADGETQVILSSLPDAYGVYVAKVTNAQLFSALMVDAIADRLAMELCMPMSADARYFQLAQARFTQTFLDAASRQLEQDRQPKNSDAPSVRARS